MVLCVLGSISCSTNTSTNTKEESKDLFELLPGTKLVSSDKNQSFAVQKIIDDRRIGVVYELLYRNQNGKAEKVCDFDRWAEGAWSPDNKYVMFNFHDESNTSTCKVFDTRSGKFIIDLRELLQSNVEKDTWYPLFSDSDKMYVAGHSWIDEGTITFSVRGWGADIYGFYDAEFEYNVIKGVTKISLCFSEEAPSELR